MDPTASATLTPSRPVLSLAEAVEATRKSRNTLRRLLKSGEIEGAAQLPGGSWAIPVDGLLAAGLHLHPPTPGNDPGPEQGPTRGHDPSPDGEVERLKGEVARLQVELAAARTAADERARSLDDLRLALRMLTPPAPEPAPVNGPRPGRPVEPPGKGWLRRRRR